MTISATVSAAEAAERAAEHIALPFYGEAEFWVGLAFLLVVAIAFRKVYAAVTAMLDARSSKIKETLGEARKLREDAQALLADYQRRKRDAMREAESIVTHAQHEAERLKKEAEDALEDSISHREMQARDRITQAEAQAMADIRDVTVDMAVAAASRLIAQEMGSDTQDLLVAASIQDLPGKLH